MQGSLTARRIACRASRAAVAVALLVALLLVEGSAFQATARLPAQLSDEAFWALITELSEPQGIFPSDNFVSNERSYQHVLDDLAEGRQPASAYLGVGPEQNFTYLLALKPQIAFIVDIRRQNLVQHLMYKALFELSADRAEFLSRLFSRARPEVIERDSTVVALLDAFSPISTEPTRLDETLRAVKERLITTHGFTLNEADLAMLERVVRAFAASGPNLTYSQAPAGLYPTFAEIVTATDRTGAHRGFLASEANFLAVQDLHRRNLIVPIVGDFAGPSALAAVGQYLKARDATVTAFYTSNVEQYLFGMGAWRRFYANVATLPVTEKSVFVRGLIRSATGEYSESPALPRTSRYEMGLFPIVDLVNRFTAGTIVQYHDLLGVTRRATPTAP